MSVIAARLAELGLELPAVAKPVAAYVPAVVTGNLVFTAGQLPFVDGTLLATGKVGDAVTPEEAAAVLAAVARWQAEFDQRWGVRFVYATDEWFLVTGRRVPPHARVDEDRFLVIRISDDRIPGGRARCSRRLPRPCRERAAGTHGNGTCGCRRRAPNWRPRDCSTMTASGPSRAGRGASAS